MSKKSIANMLERAQNIKLSLPKVDIDNLHNQLAYVKSKINQHKPSFLLCGCFSIKPISVSNSFKRAINSMNKQQMAEYYLMIWHSIQLYFLHYSQSQQNQISKRKSVKQQYLPVNQQNQIFQDTILLRKGKIFTQWNQQKIQINRKQKTINFDGYYKIDLHNYLVRQSKRPGKLNFVLQCVLQNQDYQSLRLSTLQQKHFINFYTFIRKIIREAQKQNIHKLLHDGGYDFRLSLKSIGKSGRGSVYMVKQHHSSIQFQKIQQNNIFRNSNHIKSKPQRSSKAKLIDINSHNQNLIKIFEKKLSKFNEFQKISPKLYYQIKGKKVKKVYQISKENIKAEQLVKQLQNCRQFFKWKPTLKSVDLIKKQKNGKCHIFHQLHHYPNDQQIQYLYSRNYLCQNNIHYFLDKPIKEKINIQPKAYKRGQIKSVIWRIKDLDNNNIQVLIQADISHGVELNQKQLTQKFLGNFDQLQQNLRINFSYNNNFYQQSEFNQDNLPQINNEDIQLSFYSINDSQVDQKIDVNKYVNFNIRQQSQKNFQNKQDSGQQQVTLYNCKHLISPNNNYQRKLQSNQNGHFMFEGQWQIQNNGDIININKQKIQRQNNAVSLVLKTLGMNILRGKNIMNVSLPVNLCNQRSFVQSLCHSLAYAPLILQKPAKSKDPIERFKAVVCLISTIMFLHLQIDKPFNPILGQTYQAVIDGCPVYGQQISHHPPVSRIFMKGRGYTIYGYREPKIQVGFNSVTAVSDGDINVSFNEEDVSKDVITLGCVYGQIKNVIFGQRAIRVIKQTPFVDRTNNLYCNLHWGKGSNPSGKLKNLHNSLYGVLIQIKQNFDFLQQPKQKDILRQIGVFNGTWLDKVYFQNQLLMDFNTITPCIVEDYQPCLESDSRKRKDIIFRRRQQWEQSQQAKQQLQDLQRIDKKLRQNYKTKNNIDK